MIATGALETMHAGVPSFGLPEACDVLRAGALRAPVLFASPHSGSFYPQGLLEALQVPVMDLRRTEDALVDQLFSGAVAAGVVLIRANFARAFVDLNRDARELDPDMFADGVPRTCGMPTARVRAGLGCLPRIGATGREIYARKLCREDGLARLERVHDVYHARLSETLAGFKQDFADCVLIDCHSMPSVQPGRSGLPDIVLGDRFGSSCSGRLTAAVERVFRRNGLSVVRNAPYAGGYTTRRYGRPRSGVHALQIEINRGLYLDEERVEPSAGFARVQSVLDAVIAAVIDWTVHENG